LGIREEERKERSTLLEIEQEIREKNVIDPPLAIECKIELGFRSRADFCCGTVLLDLLVAIMRPKDVVLLFSVISVCILGEFEFELD
jgi:hypothetical protein